MDPTDPSYYADLTKFEMVELMLMFHSSRLEQISILIALFSGYLATAYLVAKKLTQFQLVAITLFYSVLVLLSIAGYMGLSVQAAALDEQRSGLNELGIFQSIGATFLAAWILSITFMWHSRRTGE